MATESQLRASKRYQDRHKEDVKFNTKKSHAKWFIKHCGISRLDDLKELRELINSRIEQLENEK
ncbi:hypothetical protein GBO69_08755 [Pediococcus pentosaceus]|uniref:hypothetical protein n=1 Tax=Pediococcus pentosaceus TaxID=1255 RepID=UPI00132BB0E9|nr:hypothetical protein [Pediococcus pentosaceus]KAF0392195.1 hypothetical protein GBO69_08755 [Pediococcus pentosaceus]